MINRIIEKMGLSESEKAYLEPQLDKIMSKTQSIWQVVEDSAGYG